MAPKKRRKRPPQRLFDTQRFLDSAGAAKKIAKYQPAARKRLLSVGKLVPYALEAAQSS